MGRGRGKHSRKSHQRGGSVPSFDGGGRYLDADWEMFKMFSPSGAKKMERESRASLNEMRFGVPALRTDFEDFPRGPYVQPEPSFNTWPLPPNNNAQRRQNKAERALQRGYEMEMRRQEREQARPRGGFSGRRGRGGKHHGGFKGGKDRVLEKKKSGGSVGGGNAIGFVYKSETEDREMIDQGMHGLGWAQQAEPQHATSDSRDRGWYGRDVMPPSFSNSNTFPPFMGALSQPPPPHVPKSALAPRAASPPYEPVLKPRPAAFPVRAVSPPYQPRTRETTQSSYGMSSSTPRQPNTSAPLFSASVRDTPHSYGMLPSSSSSTPAARPTPFPFSSPQYPPSTPRQSYDSHMRSAPQSSSYGDMPSTTPKSGPPPYAGTSLFPYGTPRSPVVAPMPGTHERSPPPAPRGASPAYAGRSKTSVVSSSANGPMMNFVKSSGVFLEDLSIGKPSSPAPQPLSTSQPFSLKPTTPSTTSLPTGPSSVHFQTSSLALSSSSIDFIPLDSSLPPAPAPAHAPSALSSTTRYPSALSSSASSSSRKPSRPPFTATNPQRSSTTLHQSSSLPSSSSSLPFTPSTTTSAAPSYIPLDSSQPPPPLQSSSSRSSSTMESNRKNSGGASSRAFSSRVPMAPAPVKTINSMAPPTASSSHQQEGQSQRTKGRYPSAAVLDSINRPEQHLSRKERRAVKSRERYSRRKGGGIVVIDPVPSSMEPASSSSMEQGSSAVEPPLKRAHMAAAPPIAVVTDPIVQMDIETTTTTAVSFTPTPTPPDSSRSSIAAPFANDVAAADAIVTAGSDLSPSIPMTSSSATTLPQSNAYLSSEPSPSSSEASSSLITLTAEEAVSRTTGAGNISSPSSLDSSSRVPPHSLQSFSFPTTTTTGITVPSRCSTATTNTTTTNSSIDTTVPQLMMMESDDPSPVLHVSSFDAMASSSSVAVDVSLVTQQSATLSCNAPLSQEPMVVTCSATTSTTTSCSSATDPSLLTSVMDSSHPFTTMSNDNVPVSSSSLSSPIVSPATSDLQWSSLHTMPPPSLEEVSALSIVSHMDLDIVPHQKSEDDIPSTAPLRESVVIATSGTSTAIPSDSIITHLESSNATVVLPCTCNDTTSIPFSESVGSASLKIDSASTTKDAEETLGQDAAALKAVKDNGVSIPSMSSDGLKGESSSMMMTEVEVSGGSANNVTTFAQQSSPAPLPHIENSLVEQDVTMTERVVVAPLPSASELTASTFSSTLVPVSVGIAPEYTGDAFLTGSEIPIANTSDQIQAPASSSSPAEAPPQPQQQQVQPKRRWLLRPFRRRASVVRPKIIIRRKRPRTLSTATAASSFSVRPKRRGGRQAPSSNANSDEEEESCDDGVVKEQEEEEEEEEHRGLGATDDLGRTAKAGSRYAEEEEEHEGRGHGAKKKQNNSYKEEEEEHRGGLGRRGRRHQQEEEEEEEGDDFVEEDSDSESEEEEEELFSLRHCIRKEKRALNNIMFGRGMGAGPEDNDPMPDFTEMNETDSEEDSEEGEGDEGKDPEDESDSEDGSSSESDDDEEEDSDEDGPFHFLASPSLTDSEELGVGAGGRRRQQRHGGGGESSAMDEDSDDGDEGPGFPLAFDFSSKRHKRGSYPNTANAQSGGAGFQARLGRAYRHLQQPQQQHQQHHRHSFPPSNWGGRPYRQQKGMMGQYALPPPPSHRGRGGGVRGGGVKRESNVTRRGGKQARRGEWSGEDIRILQRKGGRGWWSGEVYEEKGEGREEQDFLPRLPIQRKKGKGNAASKPKSKDSNKKKANKAKAPKRAHVPVHANSISHAGRPPRPEGAARGSVPVPHVSPEGTLVTVPLTSENLGHRMLSRMGWTGGGLGKSSDGLVDPIAVQLKRNKRGLGASAGGEGVAPEEGRDHQSNTRGGGRGGQGRGGRGGSRGRRR